MPLACRYCIAEKGLRGSEIASLPQTDEELFTHIESEHHIAVRRAGESKAAASARFRRQYPEAADPKTCKCPDCKRRRTA